MAKFTKSMSFVRNENYNHNLNVITERINSLEKAIADFKFNVAVQIDNHSDLIIKNRERITKLENAERNRNFTEYVKDLDWIVKEKSTTGNVVKNCFEKMENTTSASVGELSWIKKEKQLDDDFDKEIRKLNEEYDQKLVFAKEDHDIPYQKELIKERSKLDVLTEENKKLCEENNLLKEEIEKLVSVVHNLRKVYGGAK